MSNNRERERENLFFPLSKLRRLLCMFVCFLIQFPTQTGKAVNKTEEYQMLIEFEASINYIDYFFFQIK